MAKAKNQPAADSTPAGVWTPPANAQPVELAEFYKPTRAGQTIVGRIERTTSRPDPLNKERMMTALILSPALTYNPGHEPEAFGSLALGFSSHLQLLVGDPAGEVGNAFAFTYDGTRPAQQAGKQASHQWTVHKLSESQFRAEVTKVAKADADFLLAGGSKPASAPSNGEDGDGDDDVELPF